MKYIIFTAVILLISYLSFLRGYQEGVKDGYEKCEKEEWNEYW